MRRLGLLLALTACVPGTGENSSQVALSTSTSGEETSGSGIFTVTSNDVVTGPDTTETPDSTATTALDDTSTGDDPASSSSGDASGGDPFCGNGVLDRGEECDDGDDDEGDECTTQCRPPRCGDGILHAGEACDDGNASDNDGCTNACLVAFCGDGKLWEDEEDCDDGNAIDTDDCLPNCKLARCGDGKLWAGKEVCDDGFNDNEYNGCAPNCQSKASTYCGDGVRQPQFEHCDGATGMNGVGCTKACLYDFSAVPQMSCNKTCTWGGTQGCGQDDADAFCKLRTGNPTAKATSYTTAPPTDLGGFPCSDLKVYIELNGMDPRLKLGLLPEFNVSKAVLYQPTKIKSTHGDSPVIQATSLVCTP